MLGVTQDRLLVAESVQVSGAGAVPPSFIIFFVESPCLV